MQRRWVLLSDSSPLGGVACRARPSVFDSSNLSIDPVALSSCPEGTGSAPQPRNIHRREMHRAEARRITLRIQPSTFPSSPCRFLLSSSFSALVTTVMLLFQSQSHLVKGGASPSMRPRPSANAACIYSGENPGVMMQGCSQRRGKGREILPPVVALYGDPKTCDQDLGASAEPGLCGQPSFFSTTPKMNGNKPFNKPRSIRWTEGYL